MKIRFSSIHIFILPLLLIILSSELYAQKPLIGIVGIGRNSPRTMTMVGMLEEHIVRINDRLGVFTSVNSKLLTEQIQKFKCSDEKCFLRFAKTASINVIIRGRLEDHGAFIRLTLKSFGTDIPYQGKVIYTYTVEIPMEGSFSPRELSYISEEHAGFFLSGLFKYYKIPVYADNKSGETFYFDKKSTGKFALYQKEFIHEKGPVQFLKIGKATLDRGIILKSTSPVKKGTFILSGFKHKSDFLKDFYYNRKKEIVFQKPEFTSTLYKILLAGPASAVMPIAAPIFGYYRNSDWNGLLLWSVNLTPYLYVEINGLTVYFRDYYKKRKNIPQNVRTQYHFALYMISAGGVSLFADAFSHSFLKKAANYQGVAPLMGNNYSAAFLSLVSGGGGHFYKGSRLFGYLYFHATNVLMYLTMREFSTSQQYLWLDKKYTSKKINKLRAYAYLGAACAVKIADIIHAVLAREQIRNGDIVEEGYSFYPIVSLEENNTVNVALGCSYRFQ